MTLVLNNDGMAVKMEGEHLVVKNHVDGSARTIPLVSVARVFVLGAPAITYPVIIALMERDIPCVFMAKSGRVRGSLDIWGGSFSRRRMQQYDLFRDPSRRMELSRGLVRAKLANCRRVIQRLCANRHISINELDENWRMVNGCLARLDSARSIDELRGLEGKAGYGYFRLLGTFFPERFPFVERTRRPPKDPANALLSYVYMLLASEMEAVIRAHLLDAGFGFMHCDKLSAPALALDLMEPFRPIIDQWVSQQRFNEFTGNIKIGLVSLLSVELKFNGRQQLLSNAIKEHVANCLHFLSEETDQIQIEVEIPNEVSSHAINGHV